MNKLYNWLPIYQLFVAEMNTTNTKKLLIIGGIGLGLAAIGTFSYFLLKQSKVEEEIELDNTFEDKKLGVELKHPENFEVEVEDSQIPGLSAILIKSPSNIVQFKNCN